MSPRTRFSIAVVLLVVALVAFSGWMAAGKRPPQHEPSAFAQAVDLTAFDNLAVHTDGRLKSYASFAHEIMALVLGPRRYEGQSPSFTYLDMMLRPRLYTSADVVYVKNKNLRREIREAFEGSTAFTEGDTLALRARLDDFMSYGLISPEWLDEPSVQARLDMLQADLMRTARPVQEISGALAMMYPMQLRGSLRLVPPASGRFDEPWSSPAMGGPVAANDPALASQVSEAWKSLESTWAGGDAVGVNAALGRLVQALPQVAPALYPDADKLAWESWYFEQGNMNWIWMVYLLSVVLLLLYLVYRWPLAFKLGLGTFVASFLLHSCALGLRWWVSGRWPNSNMFEAVTTSAWMGGCAALVFECVARRSAMTGLFALTSASASMVALMCAHFLPLQLNPNIGNMMPVLHDVWLYIHTNVIIWSYILIFMAAITGLLYLIHRACGAQRESLRVAGASIAELSMVATAGAMPAPSGRSAGGKPASHAAGSGVASVGAGAEGDSHLGVKLDGVTMALMKLSFVMLWAGLVMGAIWADHSWGRPWGWDPKEVFALCTFVSFAVLVHVRFKARDKGLWTALLAVFGAGVMLFNWIVINFYISGLHSYA